MDRAGCLPSACLKVEVCMKVPQMKYEQYALVQRHLSAASQWLTKQQSLLLWAFYRQKCTMNFQLPQTIYPESQHVISTWKSSTLLPLVQSSTSLVYQILDKHAFPRIAPSSSSPSFAGLQDVTAQITPWVTEALMSCSKQKSVLICSHKHYISTVWKICPTHPTLRISAAMQMQSAKLKRALVDSVESYELCAFHTVKVITLLYIYETQICVCMLTTN